MKNPTITEAQFQDALIDIVQEYIDNFDRFDSNPQLRINPATLAATLENGADMLTDIADSDEAVEDAVAAQGAEDEDATDFQVTENPDFYPVKSLLAPEGNTDVPDKRAIAAIVRHYF